MFLAKLWSTSDLNEEMRAFRCKMDYLSAQQTDVLMAVEHAELLQPGKKRKREVKLWCELVKKKKIKLQEIDSVFINEGPSSALKNQLAKEINEVEGLIHQGKFPSGVVLDNHSATRLEMVVSTLVGSRIAENIEMILKWLKQDDVFAIGVCGMGGVGKTALLKKIHNSLLCDSDIEGQVYWVTASQNCNLQKLQTAIGKCLGLLDISKEDDVERRRSLIFHRLSQLQKSVLIIDDMWNHFLTDQVGIPLDSCGCKVIITTRLEEVCRKMGCQKVIKVNPLPEDDAWFLFVEKSGEVADYLYSTAKEIVKECGGLPLALNTMGCCMREVTDVQQWKIALYELQKPTRRQDDMDDHVFRVLQYSYDSLRDERLKQCFLSCVLFPEDWVISREELIDLWIMEGLLDDIESWENKKNKGHTIVNILERSSLLEPAICYDEEKGVRMHDLVRDMAMIVTQHHPRFMAKAGLRLKTIPGDELWTRDLVKVSLSHNRIKEIPLGMSPETPNLRVLILSHNPLKEIPDSFFVHMKALEVIDLSYVDIKRLPDTVSDLVNLRALLLIDCCMLSYVPSVAKLTKLMTLDVPERLAPEGRERLKCLKKLSCCHWRLSELPQFNSFIQSCQLDSYRICLYGDVSNFFELNEKGVMISGAKFGQTEITPVLPCNIRALYVFGCRMEGQRSLGKFLPSLRDARSLSVLKIKGCVGLKYLLSVPHCVSSVSSYLDNLEYLELIDLTDLRSIGENGSFSSFSHLKDLMIKGCESLKYISSASCGVSSESSHFEILEVLKLVDLPNLRNMSENGPFSSFSHLKELEISKCPKLKAVLPSMSSQQKQMCLPHLNRIRVDHCEEVEEIFESNRELLSAQKNLSPGVALPKLLSLELEGLPKLRNSYSIHLCTSLQHLRISDCAKLEGIVIFPACDGDSAPIPCFRSLSELYLSGLPLLSSIYSMQLDLCTSLERIDIRDCAQLEGIVRSPTCDGDTAPIPCFRSLSELYLIRLPLLSSIYSMQLDLCTSLKRIDIRDCAKLEGIVRSPTCVGDAAPIPRFRSLSELYLIRLPLLSSIYSMQLDLCTSLQHLRISDCAKLEGIVMSPTCDGDSAPIPCFPSLSELYLSDLPLLSSTYSMQLDLCTSLKRIDIRDCAKLEGIVRSPTCDGDAAPIPRFRSLSELYLIHLPLFSSIYQMRLHHATSLHSIYIRDCPKLEEIFASCTADTKSILTLPKLQSLLLSGLPNLSSLYKGLLMFASLEAYRLNVYECPKLKMLTMSSCQLICDTSESTLASLPTESESPEWWEPLHQHFPDDVVIRLSDYILQARQSLLDDKTNRDSWGSWLSLSTS